MGYRPKFTKFERDGKISLWVTMPNGEDWNIWDMAETNPWIESAIISAFERGCCAYRMACPEIHVSTLDGFKEKK